MGLACWARYEENYLKEKMAEIQSEAEQDWYVYFIFTDSTTDFIFKVCVEKTQ